MGTCTTSSRSGLMAERARASPTGAGTAICSGTRPVRGNQWSSQSSKRSRSLGATSEMNRSVFSIVVSRLRLPNCSSTMR